MCFDSNRLKLVECMNGKVLCRNGMKNGVVTGLLINNCSSSLKISSKNDINAEIQYDNGHTLICDPDSSLHSPPPTSPEVDSDDYFHGNMVSGHHLDLNSRRNPLHNPSAPGSGNCYYSGILPSPSSCGDSFKSVSSPESEFAEPAPPDDDQSTNSTLEDHHISSLCSLTVPEVFKSSNSLFINSSGFQNVSTQNNNSNYIQTRAKDQILFENHGEKEVLRTECDSNSNVVHRTLCDEKSDIDGLKLEHCDKIEVFRNNLNDLTQADEHAQDESNSQVKCKWRGCDMELQQSSDIMEHIIDNHINRQLNCKEAGSKFVCLWQGCKVYDKPSSSGSWLERHVMIHGGHKPFKCIVDGCKARFTSKNALERHVNAHFKISQNSKFGSVNGDCKNGDIQSNSSKNGSTKSAKEESPCKPRRKRPRFKRSWWKATAEDFIDSGIMDHIRHRVMLLNQNTSIDVGNCGHSITMNSQVIAKRTEESGKVLVLLHWYPEDVIPDSWEPEVNAQRTKIIPIRSLPHDVDVRNLLSLSPFTNRKSKRKRK